MVEGIPEIFLSTQVSELEVLYESIMDFDNLILNASDLSTDVVAQGWEVFFNRMKGLMYPAMVKDFWIHVTTTYLQISSYVMGKTFQISEKNPFPSFRIMMDPGNDFLKWSPKKLK